MEKEKFLPVVGLKGKYLVSNTGRVLNARTGCELIQSPNEDGYMRVDLNGKHRFIHQLVASAFNGPIPKGLVVHHRDHNKLNNCADNLLITTQTENMRLARLAGRIVPPKTKLTSEQVRQIRSPELRRLSSRVVGLMFNVTKENIGAIWRGQTWKHLLETSSEEDG